MSDTTAKKPNPLTAYQEQRRRKQQRYQRLAHRIGIAKALADDDTKKGADDGHRA